MKNIKKILLVLAMTIMMSLPVFGWFNLCQYSEYGYGNNTQEDCMSLENSVVMIIAAYGLVYVAGYRKNHFFGNIAFICLSMFTMYYGGNLAGTASSNVFVGIGGILLIGSFLSLLYDIGLKASQIRMGG